VQPAKRVLAGRAVGLAIFASAGLAAACAASQPPLVPAAGPSTAQGWPAAWPSAAPGFLAHAAFARDGKRWAAIEWGEMARPALVVGDVAGPVRRRYPLAGGVLDLAWAGDDRTILVADHREANPPAAASTQLVAVADDGATRAVVEREGNIYPMAAPPGAFAAYAAVGADLVDRCHLVDLSTGADEVLAEAVGAMAFKWSVEGDRLAYVANASRDLFVIDRRDGKRHALVETQVQQFFWVGAALAVVSAEAPGALVTRSVDGRVLARAPVTFPFELHAVADGRFWPSPSGTRLLGLAEYPLLGRSAVLGVPEQQLVDTSSSFAQASFFHWTDDDHVVKLVANVPYASEVVPITVPAAPQALN
jgi:hypothetical protein